MISDVEARLRETLESLAGEVTPSPRAYRRAQATWRRRERRRRILLVVLATLLIGGADAVGLWALNSGPTRSPVIFDAPAPVQPALDRLVLPSSSTHLHR